MDSAGCVSSPSGQIVQSQQQSAPSQSQSRREEGKAVLSATPTFDRVFRVPAKRNIFYATRNRAATANPSLEQTKKLLDKRLRKVKKCCSGKHGRCIFKHLRHSDDFMNKVCEWRVNWKMTPRAMRTCRLVASSST